MTREHDYFQFDAYPFADTFPVGENTVSYITRMREPVLMGEVPTGALLVGDVLRRTCQLAGAGACQAVCQAPEGFDNLDKRCSDSNVGEAADELGIARSDLLMVGVTADNVGFYDQVGEAETTVNSAGIRELKGYNAFFARASEGAVLGAQLADCGFAAIEMKDREGEDVFGFVHLTRPNLQGETAFKFEVDDRPAGCFEYFLHEALQHYGGELSDVRVRVTAAIKGENYRYVFSHDKGPENLFPGWLAQGLLVNTTNLATLSGKRYHPDDVWEPRYREMVRWQILRSGLDESQLDMAHAIDPADLELGHASNRAGKHGRMPDARDAYLVRSILYSPSEQIG